MEVGKDEFRAFTVSKPMKDLVFLIKDHPRKAGAILFLFAFFIWPTPYEYWTLDGEYSGTRSECLVSRNRITGTMAYVCGGPGYLQEREWRKVGGEDTESSN